MILCALDLASATGIAVGDPRGEPTFWTERLGEASAKQGARFTQALIMTKRIIEQHNPDLIAIEAALAGGGGGAQQRVQLAMGLRACVMSVCFSKNVRCKEFAVSTIRKHFIGNGRVKRTEAKRQTINECQMKGWQVDNDNEADALALWDMVSCQFGGRQSLRSGNLFEQGAS